MASFLLQHVPMDSQTGWSNNNNANDLPLVIHAMKHPIAILQGMLQAVEEPGWQEARSLCLRQVGRLIELTDRLLLNVFSNPLKKCNIDLNQVLHELVELVIQACEGRKIRFSKRIEKLPSMWGDHHALLEALFNFFVNGIEAIEEEGVISLKADVVQTRENGVNVRLMIGNNGPPIGGDEVERLFLPGYTTKEKGHGRGLWIAKEVIEAHGGEIALASTTSLGTYFEISLPVLGIVNENIERSWCFF